MFNKLKNKANEAADKAKEMKQNYDDEKRNKWIGEVQLQTQDFKEIKEWFDLYEPKKQKEEKKQTDEEKGESAIKQKVVSSMVDSITKNIVKYIAEAMSYANEFAAKQIVQKEPQVFSFMNSLTAVFLTYRFQAKNKKKFEYIRGIAVDRVALTLIQVIDYEAQKMGKQVDQIDPQMVNTIIDNLVNTAINELEKQKQVAIDRFKASPLFAATGVQGQQVDEGVQMIIETIQGYAEKKIGTIISFIRVALPQLLQVITQHQQAIRANLAAKKNQEPSEEYINNTRAQIANKIDGYHQLLHTKIFQFMSGFFGIVTNNTNDDQ